MPANTSNHPPTAWQRLKKRSLSVEAIRQVDRSAVERFHMHSLVLMENAAIGCAQWLTHHFPRSLGFQAGSGQHTQPGADGVGLSGSKSGDGSTASMVSLGETDLRESNLRAVILCGRGNNGGDGLAIARHLRLAGWTCHVIQLGPIDKLSPDARSNWDVLNAVQVCDCLIIDEVNAMQHMSEIERLVAACDVIIDALLGSGAQGAPRSPISELIHIANSASAARVAIDIPSGLDATTGQPAAPTFCAQATLTFVARKVGFDAPAAKHVLGQVEVLPIGIPVELIRELLQ